MDLSDLLQIDAVLPHLKVRGKKQALQELANKAADLLDVEASVIFEKLLAREKLGTTGVGQGIAIPHGKLEELDRVVGVFARLDRPIDFDSVDGQPVDLIFMLIAPDTEAAGGAHLKALARVSRLLRNQSTVEKLRGSDSAAALYAILTAQQKSHAA